MFSCKLFSGPAGLAYIGDSQLNSTILLNADDSLRFELRVNSLDSFGFIVCESLGNSTLQPSLVLGVQTALSISTCIQAFGAFSRPYAVEVSVATNFSVFSERMIKVVSGKDCNTIGIVSETLIVEGKYNKHIYLCP